MTTLKQKLGERLYRERVGIEEDGGKSNDYGEQEGQQRNSEKQERRRRYFGLDRRTECGRV